MAEPMTDARRAEIRAMSDDHRQRAGQHPGPTWGAGACCSARPVAATVPELLDEVERLRAELERFRAEVAKPRGDEVLDWVAECAVEGHPDFYWHSENWPYENRDCPTCAVEKAEAERDRLAEQVKRVRAVARHLRDRETDLKKRLGAATNDRAATALLSSAALVGDAAWHVENALGGES